MPNHHCHYIHLKKRIIMKNLKLHFLSLTRNRSESSAAESNLWLCLYPDCFMLGCSEGADHSSRHHDNYPEHFVQLNVDTRRIWCYRLVAAHTLLKSSRTDLVNIMPIPRQIVQIQLIFVTFLDSLIWPYGITFYLYIE